MFANAYFFTINWYSTAPLTKIHNIAIAPYATTFAKKAFRAAVSIAFWAAAS